MARINLTAPPAFGLVGPKVNADEAGRALGKGHHTLRKIADNGLKSAGYIPIIGIVSGVVRIARAVFSEYKPSSPNLSLAGHIFRGIVEIMGLGAVFLPVDLVTTVYRRFFKDPAPPQTPEIGPRPAEESAGLTENPVTAVPMTGAGSNNVSSDDGVSESEVTDDSSENSSTETDSEEIIPLAPQENEPPPPVMGELFLKMLGRKDVIKAENVRFGPGFEEDIYHAVVNADQTYQGLKLTVVFQGKPVDEEGRIDGEFPHFTSSGWLSVSCRQKIEEKSARNMPENPSTTVPRSEDSRDDGVSVIGQLPENTETHGTDDSSKNSSEVTDPKPIVLEETSLLVNQALPPVLEKINLFLPDRKIVVARNVRLGPNFEEDIYNAIVEEDEQYKHLTPRVCFSGHRADSEGRIKGEFPDYSKINRVLVVFLDGVKTKSARSAAQPTINSAKTPSIEGPSPEVYNLNLQFISAGIKVNTPLCPGPGFQAQVYQAIVSANNKYIGKSLMVIANGQVLDEEGRMASGDRKGEFPNFADPKLILFVVMKSPGKK